MKWTKHVPPKLGDERTYKKFCWLPRETDDGWIVWLDWVDITEKLISCPYYIPNITTTFYRPTWRTIKCQSIPETDGPCL